MRHLLDLDFYVWSASWCSKHSQPAPPQPCSIDSNTWFRRKETSAVAQTGSFVHAWSRGDSVEEIDLLLQA